MYLYPLVRANRTIAATLLYPSHPLQAIATSEIASIIIPFLNLDTYSKIITLMMSMSYAPKYSYYFIQLFNHQFKTYNEGEICCLLLLILYLGSYYI